MQTEAWIRDISLAQEGQHLIESAREDMPAVASIVDKFGPSKPLSGQRIATCVIPTPETGNLVWALKSLGAEVRLCSDNVISTDDRIAAAIVSWGVPVFAKRDQSRQEFDACLERAVAFKDAGSKTLHPTAIIDDGFDLTKHIHRINHQSTNHVRLVTEQTTCGVNFAKALARDNKLRVAVVDINTGLKAAFDNRYGPRESLIPAIKACKEMQLGGKIAVVIGYGMVGQGCVEALQMAGCRVLIAESSPIPAAKALMNGLEVVRVDEVLDHADLFITASSSLENISLEQMVRMKSGATLCNMGENLEYEAHRLPEFAQVTKTMPNPNFARYTFPDGRYIDSLCDGYLLNMRTGGNPPRVLGITFALHIMAQIKGAQGWQLERGKIHQLPIEVDEEVALLNFPQLRNHITQLSPDQRRYMGQSIE